MSKSKRAGKRAVQIALSKYIDAAIMFRKIKEGEVEMIEGLTRVDYRNAQAHYKADYEKKLDECIGYPPEDDGTIS